MEWSYIVIPVVIGVFLFGVIGVGYWLYIRGRPKKETFYAEVYEEVGSMNKLRDKEGHILKETIPINALKLIGTDVIDKLEVGKGLSPYRLVKANESIGEVRAEHITNMPDGKRKVHVLKKGTSYTLMSYGSDPVGRLVFRPLPYSVSTILLHNYHLKKIRTEQTKDHIKALVALGMVVVVIFGFVGISYFLGQAWIKSSTNIREMNKDGIKAEENRIKFQRETYGSIPTKVNPDQQLGRQDLPAES